MVSGATPTQRERGEGGCCRHSPPPTKQKDIQVVCCSFNMCGAAVFKSRRCQRGGEQNCVFGDFNVKYKLEEHWDLIDAARIAEASVACGTIRFETRKRVLRHLRSGLLFRKI